MLKAKKHQVCSHQKHGVSVTLQEKMFLQGLGFEEYSKYGMRTLSLPALSYMVGNAQSAELFFLT